MILLGFASPANADSINYYNVDMDGACKLQGHTGAIPAIAYSPYGWFCYDLGISLGVSSSVSLNVGIDLKGGVDIQNR